MLKYKVSCFVIKESMILTSLLLVYYTSVLFPSPHPLLLRKLGRTFNCREERFIRQKLLLNSIYLKVHFDSGIKCIGVQTWQINKLIQR
jgi:hypothetical protein